MKSTSPRLTAPFARKGHLRLRERREGGGGRKEGRREERGGRREGVNSII